MWHCGSDTYPRTHGPLPLPSIPIACVCLPQSFQPPSLAIHTFLRYISCFPFPGVARTGTVLVQHAVLDLTPSLELNLDALPSRRSAPLSGFHTLPRSLSTDLVAQADFLNMLDNILTQRTTRGILRVRFVLWPLAAIVLVFVLFSGLHARSRSHQQASPLVQKHIDHVTGKGGRT